MVNLKEVNLLKKKFKEYFLTETSGNVPYKTSKVMDFGPEGINSKTILVEATDNEGDTHGYSTILSNLYASDSINIQR